MGANSRSPPAGSGVIHSTPRPRVENPGNVLEGERAELMEPLYRASCMPSTGGPTTAGLPTGRSGASLYP
jgi:hypothetical protein